MMIPLHRRPSLLLLLTALGACPAADDGDDDVEPPEETGDETGEAEALSLIHISEPTRPY